MGVTSVSSKIPATYGADSDDPLVHQEKLPGNFGSLQIVQREGGQQKQSAVLNDADGHPQLEVTIDDATGITTLKRLSDGATATINQRTRQISGSFTPEHEGTDGSGLVFVAKDDGQQKLQVLMSADTFFDEGGLREISVNRGLTDGDEYLQFSMGSEGQRIEYFNSQGKGVDLQPTPLAQDIPSENQAVSGNGESNSFIPPANSTQSHFNLLDQVVYSVARHPLYLLPYLDSQGVTPSNSDDPNRTAYMFTGLPQFLLQYLDSQKQTDTAPASFSESFYRNAYWVSGNPFYLFQYLDSQKK